VTCWTLRVGVSGGGPVPPDLKRAWRDELGLPLAESYGQSELGGFVGLAPPELPRDDRIGACGPPLPDKEVRIVDDAGLEVPVGSLGEITLRGGFMTGYWRRPDRTDEVLRGGWLHTGDLGTIDRDGWVTMRGRANERLTVDGEHWYPRDIEEALGSHPAVREAALVGVPIGDLGHQPVAFVTLRERVGGPEIVAHAGQVLHRDLTRVAVVIADALPMTPTGKISKARLLEMATA
jgi:acyl-CoA synthetase (AMP-forming)/AMP-acid ligase II